MSEPLRLERAASNRSTCRATGETIEKGAWRVGIEGWVGGRMSTIWQVLVRVACRHATQFDSCKLRCAYVNSYNDTFEAARLFPAIRT